MTRISQKPSRRLRRLDIPPADRQPSLRRGRRFTTAARRWRLPIAAGIVTPLLVDGATGVVLGCLVAVGARAAVGAASQSAKQRRVERLAVSLPFALDIAAACLNAGTPLPRAFAIAASTTRNDLGPRLQQVGRALELGETVADAFERLHGLPGIERLTAAVARSRESGAALASGLTQLAERLRLEHTDRATAAASRAGVWLALPLCLCFLPAFMLAGLVPVVLSILDLVIDVH